MLVPYRENDFLALAELVGLAYEEVPEWIFLQAAIITQADNFLLWKAGDTIAGFLYVIAKPIYSVAACYLLPNYRQEAQNFLYAALEKWQEETGALAILVPEHLGKISCEFSELGFEKLVRLESIQALERVTWLPIELPEGCRIVPWHPRFVPKVAKLLAEGSRGTREGLFLCYPEPASEKACQELLRRLTADEMGTFLNDATGVLLVGEEVAGVALMFSPAKEEAMLWELAIARDYQSKGLAPALIRHLQWGTRKAELNRIRFAYCERNRAIRRLFDPQTIVSEQRETLWLWQSGEYLAQRRQILS